jgi:hypothetical protein
MRLICVCFVAIALLLTAPLSAGVPKCGYIMPSAQYPLMQPALDRYANDLRERLSTAASINFASFPGDRDAANPDNCKKYGIAGFFQPGRRWRYDANSVEVHATLTVTGCDGTIFYYADVKRESDRDPTQEPQQQIDAATAEASTALITNFEAFRRAHVTDWNKLIANAPSNH